MQCIGTVKFFVMFTWLHLWVWSYFSLILTVRKCSKLLALSFIGVVCVLMCKHVIDLHLFSAMFYGELCSVYDVVVVSCSGADSWAGAAGCGSCTDVCSIIKRTSCLRLWWITEGTTDTWSWERSVDNSGWSFPALDRRWWCWWIYVTAYVVM